MKVLCIDASTSPGSELPVDLIEGIIYTVFNEIIEDGQRWYYLEEMDPEDYYSSDGFIPLSDIDETEMVREKELIKVCS